MIAKTQTTHFIELDNDELMHLAYIAQFFCNECTDISAEIAPIMNLADDILCIEIPE